MMSSSRASGSTTAAIWSRNAEHAALSGGHSNDRLRIFNQAEIVFGAVQSMPAAVNAAQALGDERNRIKVAPASGDWAFFRVTRRQRMTPPVQRARSRSRPRASSQPRSQDPAAAEPPVLGIVPVAAGTGFFGVGVHPLSFRSRERLTPNRARSTDAEADRPQDGISENGVAHARGSECVSCPGAVEPDECHPQSCLGFSPCRALASKDIERRQ